MAISVRSDLGRFYRRLNAERKRVVPRATNRTLNEIARKARTAINRSIRQRTGYLVRDIRDTTWVRKSNFRTLTAYVRTDGRNYNIYRNRARKVKRGVSVLTGKGRRIIPGAFITGRAVGKRRSANRNNIAWLFGPGIAPAFTQPEAQAVFTKEARTFGRRFIRNIRYYSRSTGFRG